MQIIELHKIFLYLFLLVHYFRRVIFEISKQNIMRLLAFILILVFVVGCSSTKNTYGDNVHPNNALAVAKKITSTKSEIISQGLVVRDSTSLVVRRQNQ